MEKRNIYKMDDVLIIASFFMLIPPFYLSWPWLKNLPGSSDLFGYFLSAPEILGPRLTMVYLYLGGAALAQAGGRIIRAKEKKALDVLDTLLYMRKTNAQALSVQLGLSQSKVRKLVTRLSRIRSLSISMTGDEITMGPSPSGSAPANYSAPPQQPMETVEPVSEESFSEARQRVENLSEEMGRGNETGMKISGEIPEKVRADLEARLKDGSLSFTEKVAIMGKLAKAAQKGELDEVTFDKPAGEDSEAENIEKKKKAVPLVLIIILFMTPLWPIALILIFSGVYKQYKGSK